MGIRSNLDANFDYEIVDEFLDHYSLMIDSMELIILDLTKENMYQRSVQELFRIFHNIKSASSYLQIAPMARLSALVEDILDELRNKDTSANDETINWLLAISDMFSTWHNDLKDDNDLTPIKFSLLKLPDLDGK